MKRMAMTMRQATVSTVAECQGVGLHSGVMVRLRVYPAAVNSGIVFRRTDLPGQPVVPALWHRVSPSPLCTTIANDDGVSVATIEHLMAALSAMGIDNARIDIDGGEVPILDGSAAPFLAMLEKAGVRRQPASRTVIRVTKPVSYTDATHGKAAMLLPSDDFRITCHIDFASKAIGRQKGSLTLTADTFRNHVSRARTFGFLSDVEKMKAVGLARGGSLDNALVIDGDTILNPEGTRFPDECVRHKILDAVGDLALAGMPLLTHYHAEKPGHFVNYKMLEALFASPDCYVEETLEQAGVRQDMASTAEYSALQGA